MRRDLISYVDMAFGMFEHFAKDVVRIREGLGVSQEEFDEILSLTPGSTAIIETMTEMVDTKSLRLVMNYVDIERGIVGKGYCGCCGMNLHDSVMVELRKIAKNVDKEE